MMKSLRYTGALLALVGGAQLLTSCSGYIVATAPPPVRYEIVTVASSPEYVWVPGYYSNNGGNYVYVNGAYRLPPRGRTTYVQGEWQNTGRGYKRNKGRWK
jgi:hypothetical protein